MKTKDMYTEKFVGLKNLYQKERNLDMTDDQFAALVYTFPSVLVAHADGRIDEKERGFIRELPEVLTAGYIEEGYGRIVDVKLTEEYFTEIDFLINRLDKWQESFLEALKEQLHNSLNERNIIFQTMWQTADSSGDISEAERKTISEISSRLGL
jgi:uncharacterized membrane protein YebE (DUF533 family)